MAIVSWAVSNFISFVHGNLLGFIVIRVVPEFIEFLELASDTINVFRVK